MTEQFKTPKEHRDVLADEFVTAFKAKYDKGQAEHGGELYRKDCSAFAEEEILDFWAYIKTENHSKKLAIEALTRVESYPALANAMVQEALELLRGTKLDVK